MSQFPLYDSLLSSVKDKDLTGPEKKNFVNIVNKVDQKGFEYLYVLIKMYAQKETNYKSYALPFGGKYMGLNIQFELETMPAKLKQMIYKFVKTHIKTMKETEERQATIIAQTGITDSEKILI